MTIFDPPGLTLEREKRAEPRKKATTKILLRSSQRALTMMGNGWTTEAIEHTHQSTISLSACFMRGDKDDLEDASKGSYLVCAVGNFSRRWLTKSVTWLL